MDIFEEMKKVFCYCGRSERRLSKIRTLRDRVLELETLLKNYSTLRSVIEQCFVEYTTKSNLEKKSLDTENEDSPYIILDKNHFCNQIYVEGKFSLQKWSGDVVILGNLGTVYFEEPVVIDGDLFVEKGTEAIFRSLTSSRGIVAIGSVIVDPSIVKPTEK